MRRILTIYLIISFGIAALSYLVFCFFPPPLSARLAALLIGGVWPLLLLIGSGTVWIAYRVVNNPLLKHGGLCEAHTKRSLHKLNYFLQ